MSSPKLLIGMATFDDHRGVMNTVQSLRLHHAEGMREVELAVVDNNSGSLSGAITREFCQKVADGGMKVHYVAYTAATGTAAPRNHLFETGSAPVVLCIDPHVQLYPGAVRRLIDYFEANPETKDLFHGPMSHDNLRTFSTHFDDVWGKDQMWGMWANMWRCPCGEMTFTTREQGDRMKCIYCEGCQMHEGSIPDCEWAGHERRLWDAGFRPLGADVNEQPFEIPAMGLGLFACRRDAWLGFNPRFRGFGGEEWYIHEKFRKAGRKVWCLPFARWWHEFRDTRVRTPYPLDIWHKARNYVLGLQELQKPLDRARVSFVDSGRIKADDWDRLVADPDFQPQLPGCTSGMATRKRSLVELFEMAKKTPRDLDQHADYIRSLAASHQRVTAFVKRREWNVLLAAGRPRSLIVYQTEQDPILKEVHEAIKAEEGTEGRSYTSIVGGGADSLAQEIDPTDLLVLDTVHSAERLSAELGRHAAKVSERILIRGTGAFGETAEGSAAPGLLHAIRQFVRTNPEWTVVKSVKEQYGLCVLSRVEADKKPLPSLWQQGVNAAKASWRAGANVLTNYGPLLDTPSQDARLGLCLVCDSQNGGRCGECGCPIDRKTSWPSEKCPLGKWRETDASKLPMPDVQPSAQSLTPIG